MVSTGKKGVEEAQEVLRFVKGHFMRTKSNNEGFVSWYMERPSQLFASTRPSRIHSEIPNLFEVVLEEGGDPIDGPWMWRHYCHVRFGDMQPMPWQDEDMHIQKMQAVFEKQWVYNDKQGKDKKGKLGAPVAIPKGNGCLVENNCPALWCILEHVWFDTQTVAEYDAILEANLTLQNAVELTPKLAAIADSVRSNALKTVILIHEAYGALVLWWLLNLHGLNPILLRRPGTKTPKKKTKHPTQNTGTFPPEATTAYNRQRMIEFNSNDNLFGENFRVAVAVVEEFGEGVSFMGVRRIVLASLSPPGEVPRWPLVQQWVARALRMCSHDRLPEEYRTLDVDLFVGRTRTSSIRRTVDQQRLDFLRPDVGIHFRPAFATRSEIKGVANGMAQLEAVAIDAGFYGTGRSWLSWLRR